MELILIFLYKISIPPPFLFLSHFLIVVVYLQLFCYFLMTLFSFTYTFICHLFRETDMPKKLVPMTSKKVLQKASSGKDDDSGVNSISKKETENEEQLQSTFKWQSADKSTSMQAKLISASRNSVAITQNREQQKPLGRRRLCSGVNDVVMADAPLPRPEQKQGKQNISPKIDKLMQAFEPSDGFSACFYAFERDDKFVECVVDGVPKMKGGERKYEELIVRPLPHGVSSVHLPFYLSDEEFAKVFGMPKQSYVRYPKWKQDLLKRRHKLY